MRLICTIFLLCLFQPILSQNNSKIDSLLQLIDKNKQGMGSVSIFKGDKEVYQKSFGMASVVPEIEAASNTSYRIGSISKMYTATIIMQMVEEKKLSLNTKLSEYFKKVSNADQITIDQLLRHQSGIYNFTNSPTYQTYMTEPLSRKALLAKIIENGSTFSPGKKTEYSNSNYVLLSMIAEEIDKKPFREIVKARITDPLSLKSTMIGPVSNGAKSYTMSENWIESTVTDVSIPLGAGAISSTSTELNKFIYSLFNGKLITEESLGKMKELKNNFGYGMFQIPFFNKRAYGHGGGIDGFQSMLAYFPKEDVAIAYVSNGVVMPINDILIGVLSLYFEKDYTFPSFDTIEIDSDLLNQYSGVYGSSSFPLDIEIFLDGSQLKAQATGQPSFTLTPVSETTFTFDPARIKITFDLENNAMLFEQAGTEFLLSRK